LKSPQVNDLPEYKIRGTWPMPTKDPNIIQVNYIGVSTFGLTFTVPIRYNLQGGPELDHLPDYKDFNNEETGI